MCGKRSHRARPNSWDACARTSATLYRAHRIHFWPSLAMNQTVIAAFSSSPAVCSRDGPAAVKGATSGLRRSNPLTARSRRIHWSCRKRLPDRVRNKCIRCARYLLYSMCPVHTCRHGTLESVRHFRHDQRCYPLKADRLKGGGIRPGSRN